MRLRAWFRNLLRRDQVEGGMDEELRAFLTASAEQKERDGLDPAQARRAAALEMGSLDAVKENVRDARAGSAVEAALRDARFGLRQVRQAPGFAAAVILTLAVAIGASTAVFSVAQEVLLMPLPFQDPARIHMIWSNSDRAGYFRAPLSGPELQDLREQANLYQGFASIWSTTAQITGDAGPPEQLQLALVTANFFSLLGRRPALGRGFLPEEEGPGAPAVAVLSDGFWRRRFGGEPSIVGRRVRLDGNAVTIVGVAPPDLRLWFPPDANVPSDPHLIAPLPFDLRSDRALYYLRTIGRLREGASAPAAQAQVADLGGRLEAQYSEYAASGRSLFATPLAGDSVREVRPTLLALLGAVGLVLVLACVNVANLLVSRDLARRGTLALRAALGATRSRLVGQAVAETLVLAGLGVLGGLGLGVVALRGLMALRPVGLARFDSVRLDPQVLAFSAGLGLLASLATALFASGAMRVDLMAVLRGSGRSGDGSGGRLRRLLVASEVALGATLLVGAGLLVRSVVELQQVDPGFRPEGVQAFRIALPRARYASAEAGAAFARKLNESLRALPGVTAVGTVSALPFDTLPNWSSPYTYDGVAVDSRGGREADARAISPGYLAAVGARLVSGRDFGEADGPGRAPVVIVDERLSALAWPGRDAVGQRLNVEFLDPESGNFVPTWATVVGVVGHIRHRQLQRVVREQVYLPQRQSPRQPHAYLLRSSGDPAALVVAARRAVQSLDPELPVYDERPLEAYVDDALAGSRFAMRLAASFGAIALLVAAIGIYGVVAYSVARRRREIGVRLALGAATGSVLRAVIGEGMALTALGLGVGLLAAAASSLATRSLFFGVSPLDPTTYTLVALGLGATALAASAVPALRAARTNPVEILRAE